MPLNIGAAAILNGLIFSINQKSIGIALESWSLRACPQTTCLRQCSHTTSENDLLQSTVHLSSSLIFILTKKSWSVGLVSLKFEDLKQKEKDYTNFSFTALVPMLKGSLLSKIEISVHHISVLCSRILEWLEVSGGSTGGRRGARPPRNFLGLSLTPTFLERVIVLYSFCSVILPVPFHFCSFIYIAYSCIKDQSLFPRRAFS